MFKNFITSVSDTQAVLALDTEKNETLASQMIEGTSSEAFRDVSASMKKILDRFTKEFVTGSGPVSFFETDKNRLIFIKVKNVVLCVALQIDGSVDNALPYAYLTAEKIGNIMDNRPVELDIPLIKIITDEEEQKMVREHYYELRSSEGGHFGFKVIIIGEDDVGKTSLVMRHAEQKFKKSYLPTLGVSITTNTLELPLRKAKVTFSNWDFGGQSYFRRVRLSYYAGAQACFIVFDLTNRKSFENVLKWKEEKEKFAGDILTILLGNKNDLVAERAVSQEEVMEFVGKNGFTYFETSALTGANVEDAFNLLAYKLVDLEAKKVEANELDSLKEEIKTAIEDRGGNVVFGLIRNKTGFFNPLLQVFLDIESNAKVQTTSASKTYDFSFGLALTSLEITEKEIFPKYIEMLKRFHGVIGVFDARRLKNDDEVTNFARFLKLLYNETSRADFTGSIGVLCDKQVYSDLLNKLDISEVLQIAQNSKKSIFFYNLTDNYLLEIMDNLRMFFTSFSLL